MAAAYDLHGRYVCRYATKPLGGICQHNDRSRLVVIPCPGVSVILQPCALPASGGGLSFAMSSRSPVSSKREFAFCLLFSLMFFVVDCEIQLGRVVGDESVASAVAGLLRRRGIHFVWSTQNRKGIMLLLSNALASLRVQWISPG